VPSLKTLSVLGFVVMVGAIAGLFATGALFAPAPLVIAMQAAAVALMLWARVTFGARSFHAAANPTAGGLVTTGPYRFIRHPIYTAVALFATAGACAHVSVSAAALAALLVAGALARMWAEEQFLVARYAEYADYARRTKRMVPFVF
jgi:protein-S-isoprenylcysteine O-methyltransferase Ste14